MIVKLRALWRRARGVRSLRPFFEAGDRMWWAHTIRRAHIVDTGLVGAQGYGTGTRRAIRQYVRGGWREGMTLNPLLQEQLVSSQLSDVGRVPALYAYLVNDRSRIDVSVAWDARAAGTAPEALADPAGPLGFVWRSAEQTGHVSIVGVDLDWREVQRAIYQAARQARMTDIPIELSPIGDERVVVCRVDDDEDASLALRLALEFAAEGTAVILALGLRADHWVASALLALRFGGIQVVHDHPDLLTRISTLADQARVVVRGPNAEVTAAGLRSLASAAGGRRAYPLWLDSHDGTVVSAGVAFWSGHALDLLASHPVEDAAKLPARVGIPEGHGETFAYPPRETDTPLLCADVIVRAPAKAMPGFAAHPDTDLRLWLHPTGLAPSNTPIGVPSLVRPAPHPAELPDGTQVPRLRWAIKIAAPPGARGEWWGDTHYARGLAGALRRLGQDVVIDAYAARARESSYLDDVVLALRGPEPVRAQRGARSILWIISHPDQVSRAEIEEFDVVYAASQPWAAHASTHWGRLVQPLLQCTDAERFHPRGLARSGGLLFVGTARGIPRPSVIEPLRAGVPVSVFGPDWTGWIPGAAIKGHEVPNAELPPKYEAASAVLNDHWPAMRRAGFVSNRLFDVVAAGGRAISDHVAGIEELFGGAVLTYETTEELLAIVTGDLDLQFASDADVAAVSARIRAEHSFDARARQLLDQTLAP